jgi:general secretion pathway protein A
VRADAISCRVLDLTVPPKPQQADHALAATMRPTMYAKFFGLRHEPFSIAPDPRYLFMSAQHREALAHLLYGLRGGGGFVLLTGEIGAGKTTVCRCFLERVPRRCNVAYIFNPKQTVEELLGSICDEFRIPRGEGAAPSAKQHVDALNDFLLRTHAVGQNNVLIIDEAQNLSADVLEQLRLLTNLETAERKLLQIILIGQPELRDMLARPGLEQLAQRVIARYHLSALSAKETAQYIHHRLIVAGLTRAAPFDRGAVQRIHALSRGVPRRINLLCDRALLGAYASGAAMVDAAIVDKAAREVLQTRAPKRIRRRRPSSHRWRLPAAIALGVVLGAGLFAAANWMLDTSRSAPAKAAASVPSPPSSPSAK